MTKQQKVLRKDLIGVLPDTCHVRSFLWDLTARCEGTQDNLLILVENDGDIFLEARNGKVGHRQMDDAHAVWAAYIDGYCDGHKNGMLRVSELSAKCPKCRHVELVRTVAVAGRRLKFSL